MLLWSWQHSTLSVHIDTPELSTQGLHFGSGGGVGLGVGGTGVGLDVGLGVGGTGVGLGVGGVGGGVGADGGGVGVVGGAHSSATQFSHASASRKPWQHVAQTVQPEAGLQGTGFGPGVG